MMKKMFAGMLVAAAMMIGCSFTAFAADAEIVKSTVIDQTVTVDDATNGIAVEYVVEDTDADGNVTIRTKGISTVTRDAATRN